MEIAGIPAFTIKTAQRPQITFDEVQLEHMNVTRYVKGKGRWQTLQITLYDPIVPSASSAVIEWIRLHHESATGRDGYADFYKRDCQIKLLDPVGTVVELWDMKGCLLESVDYGQLSYDDDGTPTGISLGLRFDNCVLQY